MQFATITDQIMVDFTADHISNEEAKLLLADLQKAAKLSNAEFVPGVSYRNLLICRGTEQSPLPFSSHTRTRTA
ncbi:MAG: hypothetical protein U0905_18345 [Pirellulales bacterium]